MPYVGQQSVIHYALTVSVSRATQILPLWTDYVRLQHEQLERALSSAAEKGKLQEQMKRSVAEGNTYSYQLAHLHEERDKALVEMSRLEEVASLAGQEHGKNKRMVSFAHHFTISPLHHFTPSPFHPFTILPLDHFTSSPLHPFTKSPLHHFTPSPFHPFATSPLHHSTPSPHHPFTTSPRHPSTAY